MRLKPLREQAVVITGASSGIGLATARRAAARGARLVLAARSPHALASLCDELNEDGEQRAIAVIADVSQEGDVRRIADAACATFGGFDTWVNNAGVSVYGECLDVAATDLRQVIATNLWGTIHGCRIACEHLRVHGGALINVGSATSDRAVPLQGMYSASKHAIKGWTDALRVELAAAGAPVSVTLVKPGPIDTPYSLHSGNYLGTHGVHLPPVYTTASVARAILHAAEHPIRDVYVGSTARAIGIIDALVPRAVDALMQHVFIPGTRSGKPPVGRAIMHMPSEDPRETGDYPGITRPSLYTTARLHPRLTGATLLTAGLLASLAVSWRHRPTA